MPQPPSPRQSAVSRWLALALTFCLLAGFSLPASAQDTALPLQQTAEYDIGFDCPVTSTLDPAGDLLWLLMDNCGGSRFSLLAFDTANNALVALDPAQYADALTPLSNQWLDPNVKPFAFTPDGALDIFYADTDEYDTHNLRLSLDGSAAPADDRALLDLATLAALVPGYAGYPETTVYNPDHTLAAVIDTSAIHLIDLPSGTELFTVAIPPESYTAYPTFSADSQTLYVTTFNHPDDVNDYSGTLQTYALPDGAPLDSYAVPSAFLWVSPDGHYAAGILADNAGESQQLLVTELATGRTSAAIELYEPSRKLMTCANDGRDMSDVDFTVTGRLPLRDLTWLPDSSGFFTVQSYGGEAAGGGRVCYFNNSRLRHYQVGAA